MQWLIDRYRYRALGVPTMLPARLNAPKGAIWQVLLWHLKVCQPTGPSEIEHRTIKMQLRQQRLARKCALGKETGRSALPIVQMRSRHSPKIRVFRGDRPGDSKGSRSLSPI
jgi:hypothetical protein